MSRSGPTPDPEHALRVAIYAAEEAARIQRGYQGGPFAIDTKSSHTDLVTEADTASEARIREILLASFPDHAVLGEEEGPKGDEGGARHRWIVDPLDGTLNFAHGFPFYCVSIGLEVDGAMEVGVVLDSVNGELFTAMRGRGAFRDGRPITVTREPALDSAMLATGFAYTESLRHANVEVLARVLPKVRSVRRPGAAALDLCYVACGRIDGFWELSLNAWDVAAGILIVQEAGGTVTGGDGSPYVMGAPVVVASNGHLHAKLVDLLALGQAVA